MTGAHNFIRLYALVICDHAPAQRNVEDFDFVSAVPHGNHNLVGTASWQNHDSSSPQSVILLHCHVCLCLSNRNISSAYVYQTATFPLHCRDNVKVKTQDIYQSKDIPVLIRGWGEAVVTNDWRIIYSPCADPESFARGGPTLQRFFLMGGSKYHYISGPSSARQ